MKYRIVYNFYKQEDLGVYLVEAITCSIKANGKLDKRYKLAIPETLEGLASIQYKGTPHEKALQIISQLSEAVLSKKYKPKGKRKVDFKVIAADNVVKDLCNKYIGRQINDLLTICKNEKYAVTLNLVRKELAEDYRLNFSEKKYKPRVAFKKTSEGIDYALALTMDDVAFYPAAVNTVIINNQPSWVALGNHLIHIPELNGNKLKPFITKTSIHIPSRTTKIYFEKFILDLVPKVEIHTEGFEIKDESTLLNTEIKLIENLFSGEWVLRLLFHYGHYSFPLGSNIKSKTMIYFLDDQNDNIIIVNQKRNQKEENKYLSQLTELGLIPTESKTLKLKEGTNSELVKWIIDHKKEIQDIGIDLDDQIDFGGKPVNLNTYNLEVNFLKENDWFDVKGYVRVGLQDIPFLDLLNNIRENNPYFLLEDGTYFIIPQEWLTKYSSLAKFGKEDGNRFKVAKSHYGIVEELGETEQTETLTTIEIDETVIDYKPTKALKAKLRPYQLDGVKWLLKHQNNGLGACLADDMGLGKTLQVIAALLYTKEQMPDTEASPTGQAQDAQLSMFASNYEEDLQPLKALIVVPSSLVFNWLAELKKFAPSIKATSYIGSKRKERTDLLKIYDVIITTYQTALRDIDLLKKTAWTYTILDESQYIKNRNSKIFKGLSELSSEYKISISGTPIENSLSDLWSQMEFINPEILGSFEFFRDNFKLPIEKECDEYAIAELKKIVDPFLLRRTKEQVAKDLPDLIEQIIHVEMSTPQKKLFEEQKSAARNRLLEMDEKESGYKIHVFKELMALRQISNHPVLYDEDYTKGSGKFELVIHKIKTLIKANHKLLVFSSFTSYLDLIKDELEAEGLAYSYLTGSVSQAKREQAVKQFQSNSKVSTFLISIKAGGTGLNLTEADYVFILDPWWNPFVEHQAVARAHRIGQKKSVNVLKFISTDSIEEKILTLQERKLKLNSDILSEQNITSLAKADIDYLLN